MRVSHFITKMVNGLDAECWATLYALPQAVIYHAFGSIVPTEENSGLSARKLRWVVYGRLRFAGKLVSFPTCTSFLRNYGLEDLKNFFHALVRLNWSTAQALGGWWDFLKNHNRFCKRRALHTSYSFRRRLICNAARNACSPCLAGFARTHMGFGSSLLLAFVAQIKHKRCLNLKTGSAIHLLMSVMT